APRGGLRRGRAGGNKPRDALRYAPNRSLRVRRHLRLLEHHVLSSHRVVLLELELGRLGPLVLRRVVREPGSRRGNETDVVAHRAGPLPCALARSNRAYGPIARDCRVALDGPRPAWLICAPERRP